MAQAPNDRSDPHQALEAVAKEMNLAMDDVFSLYEATMAELAAKAKIDTFLHIFALRRLREHLISDAGKRRQ